MSTRAIAPVVGVGKSTVDRQVSHSGTPESATVASAEGTILAEQRHVNLEPDEAIDFETGEL